ncbi:cytochrome P450 [Thozetella sp. PMI_491]|nr:cytochrome P450 [Thozetella sp. PMI_491]
MCSPKCRFLLYLGVVVLWTSRILFATIRRRRARKSLSNQYHCQTIRSKYPHWDRFLGIDLFCRNAAAVYQRRFLQSVTQRHDELGHTYELNMLGTRGIMTRDHRIIQTILSTRFKDYSLDDERKKALRPLLGNGIFSTDGPAWAHSRAILRPHFNRAHLVDLSMLERHVSCLVDRIPDGCETDLQELLLCFTMDVATSFLLGESTDSLGLDQNKQRGELQGFVRSVQHAQDRMAIHLALGRWALLKPDPQFRHHTQVVQDFVDGFVQKALLDHQADTKWEQPAVLLRSLVQDVQDPIQIRDELINILIAGRDTTASLIGNVFFLLARHPQVWQKLREEIKLFDSLPPKFEEISQCRHIRYTINEALRLFPPVPVNSRVANSDTVIPYGGGPDGKSPVLVPEGMPVIYNVYGLHRREDIFGPDFEEFRPSRWESLRLGWEFLPFSGGPRTCIGQQFAITEASYVLIRFLQIFDTIECTDPRQWEEKIALTVSSRNGVHVKFKRAV